MSGESGSDWSVSYPTGASQLSSNWAGLMVNTARSPQQRWSTPISRRAFDSPSRTVIRSILLQAGAHQFVPKGFKDPLPGRKRPPAAENPARARIEMADQRHIPWSFLMFPSLKIMSAQERINKLKRVPAAVRTRAIGLFFAAHGKIPLSLNLVRAPAEPQQL